MDQSVVNATNVSTVTDASFTSPSPPTWVINVEITYLLIIFIFGVPGNCVIILVQKRNREKSSTDYLVMAMAVFEFFCASINAPVRLFLTTKVIWRMLASTALCRLVAFILYLTSLGSSFHLCAIAVDRYIKTCKPLSNYFTTRRARVCCAVLTAASTVLSLPSFVAYNASDSRDRYCVTNPEAASFKPIWDKILVVLGMIVFIILAWAYIHATLALNKRHRSRLRLRMMGVDANEAMTYTRDFRDIFLRNVKRKKVAPAQQPQTSRQTTTTDSSGATTSTQPAQQRTTINTLTLTSVDMTTTTNATVKYDAKGNKDSGFSVSGHEASTSSNMGTESRRRRLNDERVNNMILEEQAVNRTTKITASITLMYAFIFILNWLFILTNGALGAALSHLAKSIYMINCISNPIFFFILSSNFRKNVKKLVC